MTPPAIRLSEAIAEFLLAKQAQRFSPHTISDYSCSFRKLSTYFTSDPALCSITARQIQDFLLSLNGLSKKTLLNIHAALSSLWKWSILEGRCSQNIIRLVPAPRPEKRAIQPFSREEVLDMLAVLDHSIRYSRPGKRLCSNALPTSSRNRAILLLLLDTGIRASELCSLRIRNLQHGRLVVFGKGGKERVLPFSETTGQAISDYLDSRRDRAPGSHLFLGRDGGPLTRNALRLAVMRIGERARIVNVHPHRFRHTFALNFLRNGGNPFALQMILGHSTMEMVRRYLAMAQADILLAHRIASPVMHWAL